MTHSYTVAPVELRAAAQQLQGSGGSLGGVQLTAPDTGMYGQLVGSAARDAEPATTDDLNDLLRMLGTTVGKLGARVETTCQAYEQVEQGNADAAQGILGSLGEGVPVRGAL